MALGVHDVEGTEAKDIMTENVNYCLHKMSMQATVR
jgi:hypothetical protein